MSKLYICSKKGIKGACSECLHSSPHKETYVCHLAASTSCNNAICTSAPLIDMPPIKIEIIEI